MQAGHSSSLGTNFARLSVDIVFNCIARVGHSLMELTAIHGVLASRRDNAIGDIHDLRVVDIDTILERRPSIDDKLASRLYDFADDCTSLFSFK